MLQKLAAGHNFAKACSPAEPTKELSWPRCNSAQSLLLGPFGVYARRDEATRRIFCSSTNTAPRRASAPRRTQLFSGVALFSPVEEVLLPGVEVFLVRFAGWPCRVAKMMSTVDGGVSGEEGRENDDLFGGGCLVCCPIRGVENICNLSPTHGYFTTLTPLEPVFNSCIGFLVLGVKTRMGSDSEPATRRVHAVGAERGEVGEIGEGNNCCCCFGWVVSEEGEGGGVGGGKEYWVSGEVGDDVVVGGFRWGLVGNRVAMKLKLKSKSRAGLYYASLAVSHSLFHRFLSSSFSAFQISLLVTVYSSSTVMMVSGAAANWEVLLRSAMTTISNGESNKDGATLGGFDDVQRRWLDEEIEGLERLC
ncbi:hypothetical protein Droror1_Dr00027541 [Drosera rotundifolia]